MRPASPKDISNDVNKAEGKILDFLPALSVLCMSLLFVVWPFPHTIAARNILIAVGSLSGLFWIFFARHQIRLSGFLPHLFLLGVPCWLIILYLFFPQDSEFQYKDLTGTWIRITALIFFGFCIGKIFLIHERYLKYLYIAIVAIPLITPLAYLWFLHVGPPQPFYAFFYKTKIHGAYYVMYASMVAYALIWLVTSQTMNMKRRSLHFGAVGYILLIIFYIDFILLDSLNGVIAATLIGLFLLLLLSYRSVKNLGDLKKSFLIMILLFLISGAGIYFYKKQNSTDKLDNLLMDIQMSIDIDENHNWQRDDAYRLRNIPEPQDSSGRLINISTYERVSWFLKSVQIICEYPLGTGDPYYSFGRYMRAQYPGSVVRQSHSGWLDFAMGAGIPALLLLWLANGAVFWRAIKLNKPSLELARIIGALMLLGMGVMFWHSELADRDFLEEYFFLIALFGALLHDNK